MIDQNLLLLLLALPFIGSAVAATLPAGAITASSRIAGVTMVAGLGILAALQGTIFGGEAIVSSVQWIPSLGLDIRLRMDGFSWLFTAIVLGIGMLVVLYARYYFTKADPTPRFYALLLAFTGAMLGVLVSGNVILMVVFWELTSLISFLLIGFKSNYPAARDGARTALVVTGAGGLCLLVAMLILGRIAGSYEIERILAAGDAIRASKMYLPALILFLLAAFTKSAQMPFHFWLPGAMAAPTPVSSFLHSATMVKAGVFLLVRFSPALSGTTAWFVIVTGVGMVTLTVAAAIALYRHDLKGLLAYSTISHLGLITALAGIGSEGAILAAIFHIVNHAIFKASLFMAAGIIDHETGTRDMRRLSGLIKFMPVTGALAIVASASMAGVPLLNGFLSKEMFLTETVAWHNGLWLDNALPYIAALASMFAVAYSFRFIREVFFGPAATDLPKTPHEPPVWMRRPVEILVALCLFIGLFPEFALGPTLNVAARSVVGPAMETYHIAIWHGVNTPLLISLGALLVGSLFYLVFARRIAKGPEGPPLLHHIRAQRIFDVVLLALTWKWPRVALRYGATEKLQVQLRFVVILALVAAGLSLSAGLVMMTRPTLPLNLGFLLMWIAGGACAVGAAYLAKYHRFAALVLLGGAGVVTCLTFAWFSAPDLAVTQLLVEIVTTVLLLLGLRWLPKRSEEFVEDKQIGARYRRGRDMVFALIGGTGIAVLAYAVMTRPVVPSIGDWFLRNSYSEGGGTNVVNVILVDFRAFDTFGEITVLCIVGLTVFALLRRFRPAPESASRPSQQSGPSGELADNPMLVPGYLMRWMFPALIVMSAYLFIRGHDLPGGGFSAGVTLAIALLLQYLAADVRWIEARITILPIRWMGLGLLIAGATGIGAFAFGYPFLTAHAQYVDVPLIGKVPAATAMLFDTGVYALVVGATVLMLIAIAHQSLRSSRRRETEAEAEAEAAAREIV